jgi:hypothetical protein
VVLKSETLFQSSMETDLDSGLFDAPLPEHAGSTGPLRRPPNAFILYCLEKRAGLRSAFPGVANVDISRMMGDNWKALPESERRPYKGRAKALQDEFKRDNPVYRYEKSRQKRKIQEMSAEQDVSPPIQCDITGLTNQEFDQYTYMRILHSMGASQAATVQTPPVQTHQKQRRVEPRELPSFAPDPWGT